MIQQVGGVSFRGKTGETMSEKGKMTLPQVLVRPRACSEVQGKRGRPVGGRKVTLIKRRRRRERQRVQRGADGGVKCGMCDGRSDADTGASGPRREGEGLVLMLKCSFGET